MAFHKTLNSNDWDGRITISNAYWRLNKCRVSRMLQDPNPEDPWDGSGEDPRTSYYSCVCTFTVFENKPDMQGKPLTSMTFEVPLVDVEAQEGDTFIAKVYAQLATTDDFTDAESV